MKIGIIGGGFMGLVLAQKLASPGRSITVFERDTQLGGLATYHDFGGYFWDRFYHVILPSDADLIGFIEDVGLGEELRWEQTYTGYYVNEKFYSISNSKEFLLFPPLGLISKFRLALTIWLGSRIDDWKKMEGMTVEEWLVKTGGQKTFDRFWKPLLLAKLGENYKRVSSVFIWTYIKRLFEARDSSAKKEHMGYLSGGYKRLFDQLEAKLPEQGVSLQTGTTVESIQPLRDGGVAVTANGETTHFDKVIFTSPVNILEQVVAPEMVDIRGNSKSVEYLGVICMVVATKKSFTPYYVLNIADERVPFTGVIGMNTLVDTAETGGNHLTYFPKYVLSTDPVLRKSDEELQEWFLEGVHLMYPDLKEEDIVSVHINRAFKVQPLQVLNYSEIVPKAKTLHPDFYVLNTSQFVNNTLNNNSVTQHVGRFVENFDAEFSTPVKQQTV